MNKSCSKCFMNKDSSFFYGRENSCVSCRNARRRATHDPKKALEENLRLRFKLTVEQRQQMENSQNGVCAICSKPETAVDSQGRTKRLAIDHDHHTGRIRGLLCSKCNLGIGHLNDDSTLINNSWIYLNKDTSAFDWI